MRTTFESFMPFLTDALVVAGLFLLFAFLLARRLTGKNRINAWPATRGYNVLRGLLLSPYVPILAFALAGGGVTLKFTNFGLVEVKTMTFQGTLNIQNGRAFLLPFPNPTLQGSTLMMMKDRPLGGTQQERINAAPTFFKLTLHKDSGQQVTVTGTVEPFEASQVLVVESAI